MAVIDVSTTSMNEGEELQMAANVCSFVVMIRPADDVPGQWLSHCLALDVISLGDSPTAAIESLVEVVATTLIDDMQGGHHREPAPQEYWDEFDRVMAKGTKVALNNDVPSGRVLIATILNMRIERIEHDERVEQFGVPPSWMINQFERQSSSTPTSFQ